MKISSIKLFFLLVIYPLFCFNVNDLLAQGNNSAEIFKELKKLNQFGSVLYIAAHPDDENTRLISYLSKGKQYRVGYLSLTRGDGGQNLIGSEQGVELGLIRTNELLQARSVDGAEQFFTRAYDFGYSKTPEETLDIWNKDSILRDVVWVIRKFKPDVIITRFPHTGEGGHGHHTASAIIAREAFSAAADPNMFPEQLSLVTVWQTKKLFWNTFNFGANNTISDNQFKLDAGTYDPILGESYGEIASKSRSKHSSQGFGTPLVRTPIFEYFVNWEGGQPISSFMEGIDTTWTKCIASESKSKSITKKIESIISKYDFKSPEKSIKQLYELRKELEMYRRQSSTNKFFIDQKISSIDKIISQCAGVYCEIVTKNQNLIPGHSIEVTFSIVSRAKTFKNFELNFDLDKVKIRKQVKNGYWDTTFSFVVPENIQFNSSQPYWLRKQKSKGLFADVDLDLLGLAENPKLFLANINITFAESKVDVKLNPYLQYKYNDPSKGEVYQPVFIVPPVVIIPETDKTFFVFSENNQSLEKTFNIKVKSYADNFKGELVIDVPTGWELLNTEDELSLFFKNSGNEKNVEVRLKLIELPDKIMEKGFYDATVSFKVKSNGNEFDLSEKRISYPHIPDQIIFSKSKADLILSPINENIAQSIGRVGYIKGAGDKVMESLKEIGVDIYEIGESEINNPAVLGMYKTIIVGVRAFNVHPELKAQIPNLMEYIDNGGRLVVQYNTNNRIAPLDFDIAPYPLTITAKRVTDETAKVNFLQPNHKLMNEPFKITDSDFDSWIQERGIYFAGERDSKFVSLFSIADPNEDANDGSLVYTEYGNGSFIYTGLVFFRQLPVGNLGAYRLMVNLIFNP